MSVIASQITSISTVCSHVYSGAYQREHESSALLAFVRGIRRWPVDSPHKWPVTRELFPFDDIFMSSDHDDKFAVYPIKCARYITWARQQINTLRPRQNGRHFADDVFKCIFLNENVWISLKISLKFVAKGLIDNFPPLVQIMAWRRPGDKPLSETMMVSLLTHTCVTRPQWVNSSEACKIQLVFASHVPKKLARRRSDNPLNLKVLMYIIPMD